MSTEAWRLLWGCFCAIQATLGLGRRVGLEVGLIELPGMGSEGKGGIKDDSYFST